MFCSRNVLFSITRQRESLSPRYYRLDHIGDNNGLFRSALVVRWHCPRVGVAKQKINPPRVAEKTTTANSCVLQLFLSSLPWACRYEAVQHNTIFHKTCCWQMFQSCLEMISQHDDVTKWKHFSRYWPFVMGIHRWPVNSPHKGQWRGALMFSLICVWVNDWINNREAGDLYLRRHRAHYDVIVMKG